MQPQTMVEHAPAIEQPLLGAEAGEEPRQRSSSGVEQQQSQSCAKKVSRVFSTFFYLTCVAFCPVPLHGMLISIWTRRCCFQLPSDLSLAFKIMLQVMLLITVTNFVAAMGLVVACVWTSKIQGEYYKAGTLDLRFPGEASVYWLRHFLLMMLVRGVARWLVRLVLENEVLLARLLKRPWFAEYALDLFAWTAPMVVCLVRLFRLVYICGSQPFEQFGMDPFQRQLIYGISWLCISSAAADLLLRFAWLLANEQVLLAHAAITVIDSLPEVDIIDDCPICLTAEVHSRGSCKLYCGHRFHRVCLLSWAKSKNVERIISCPICRSELVNAEEQ
eukprot:TRINITY_DN2855_c0_g1_i1.p1 TRINITY_DN2855_c0_g1~~TRINITY_DN2855_c0_g1_i1.p1  ORF type:complete len:332 (+),score=50.72 TRINITY_DN2855_c0_g1_i1:46-1041(+)